MPAQRRQRQQDAGHARAVSPARDVEHQPVFLHAQGQVIRPAGRTLGLEAIGFQQIGDRDFAFLLDGAACGCTTLVSSRVMAPMPMVHVSVFAVEPRGDGAGMRLQPFGLGQGDGVRAERGDGVARPATASVVRFMKSSTDRPEEKRAVREVGSTWLGPAM